MSDPVFSIAGKAVLVTGAATGIGRATALLLARQGASVLGIGLDGDQGRSLEREAAGLSGRLCFREVDLTQQAPIDQAVEFAVETFGHLQGIVNNAAVCNTGKRLEHLSDTEWEATFNINVTGIFRVCRAALPILRRSGGGSIVNISSVHAVATAAGHADYAASKGAVLALSRQLALDYAADRIRVNALLIGSVDTRMSRPTFEAHGGPESLGLSFSPSAIPRVGSAEEIASVIAFLLSDASSFVNASGLVADGGLLAKLLS
jgi:NAD(P)-dependent dehydrogenase (short-subunit alcohol dehydrogenase family)